MRHPFERWPERRRGAVLAALTAAAAAVYVALIAVNQPLVTDEAPAGILSLQIARTSDRALEIVGSWRRAGALAEAGFSSGLDFLFMALYGMAGGLATLAIARRGWLPGFGAAAGWAALAGAGFDAVETAGQSVFVVGGDGGDLLARLVWAAAIAKFALLGAVLLYVLSGVPRLLGGRR